MSTRAATAWILGVPLIFPLGVFLLARRHSDVALGNALEMLFVTILGGVAALSYLCVAAWRLRTGRGRLLPWLLGAGIALSPAAYFVVWNQFFRETFAGSAATAMITAVGEGGV